jgi:hypothetical protein
MVAGCDCGRYRYLPDLGIAQTVFLRAFQMASMKNVLCTGLGRRAPRKFPIEQDVRYQCVKGSRVLAFGTGKTLEISSREIRFTTQHTLKNGEKVRLAVDWPALLGNTCLMKLEIQGWVVRSETGAAAVKIERHEFRTRGGPAPAYDQKRWATHDLGGKRRLLAAAASAGGNS